MSVRSGAATGEIRPLLETLDQAFDQRAWHGTNLRGALRGVQPDAAAWRPAPGKHNIWELVVHAAYWKYAVRRSLAGGARGGFPLSGSNFWTRPEAGRAPVAAWREDRRLLDDCHAALRLTVAAFPVRRLDEHEPRGRYTFRALIAGAALHDIYHAGQIQLLKRLQQG